MRMLRLIDEALDQGEILTQEDTARVLNVDVRTIKRDTPHLRKLGYPVRTGGQIRQIGKGSPAS